MSQTILNKSWSLLFEAIVALWILSWVLAWIAMLQKEIFYFDTTVDKTLVKMLTTKVQSQLEYIKVKNLALARDDSQVSSDFSLRNIRYPGWTSNIFPVTQKVQDPKSFNQLNGTYILTNENCPDKLSFCLSSVTAGTFKDVVLVSDFLLQNDDNSLVEGGKNMSEWTCQWEYSYNCVWYQLEIKDAVDSKQSKIENSVVGSSNDIWATKEVVKTKQVILRVKVGDDKIQESQYLLWIF